MERTTPDVPTMPTGPDPTRHPPVLFIHGIFGCPDLLSSWVERFEAAGYECRAPSLPGRNPTDEELIGRIGIPEYFEAVLDARRALDRAPIVIGHSMGGLLAQKLAAATETEALVLLASIPPGILWTQPRAFPHLLRLLPGILAGRPILASPETFRAVPFNTLPRHEQDELIEAMVPDSGRAFRSMSFGTPSTRVTRGAVSCPVLCVSGDADRNVSLAAQKKLAKRYSATHHIYPGKPHWIVADSLIDEIAPPVLDWLEAAVPVETSPRPNQHDIP